MRYNVKVRFTNDGKIFVQNNEITVSIKSKPERGKANAELIKRLSDHFSIDKGRISIISGLKTTNKIVEVAL